MAVTSGQELSEHTDDKDDQHTSQFNLNLLVVENVVPGQGTVEGLGKSVGETGLDETVNTEDEEVRTNEGCGNDDHNLHEELNQNRPKNGENDHDNDTSSTANGSVGPLDNVEGKSETTEGTKK